MTSSPYCPSRRAALGAIGAALVLPRAALASGVETVLGRAFGTDWRVVAPSGSGIARLAPEFDALFAGVDRIFSPWRADSDISRFNAGPALANCSHPSLASVTKAALDLASRSEGAFDPTVGPLVAKWGFGPIGGGVPDWRGVSAGPGGVTKARADLTLDLCGIAKGWALDQGVRRVRAAGFDDFLFELGGEFAVRGSHPSGRNWRVAVEAPGASRQGPVLRLPPGMAVATSGLAAQSYALNGRVYSHIIDPETRAPVAGGLRSVTVISERAMAADGWATALFAAGETAGPDLARAQGIAALFLIETDGELRHVRTGWVAEMIL